MLLTISSVTVWLLSKKPKSTNPLIVSLSLELFSRYLRRNPPASSALERNEYARRDRDLLWYFFRGSIWESYTRFVLVTFRVKNAELIVCRRPKLETLASRTARTPVLGLMSAIIKDWIPLIEDIYYCMSTGSVPKRSCY